MARLTPLPHAVRLGLSFHNIEIYIWSLSVLVGGVKLTQDLKKILKKQDKNKIYYLLNFFSFPWRYFGVFFVEVEYCK